MKGTRNVVILAIVALVLIFGIWGCSAYNGVIKKQENVKNAWNDVNAEYQKRADLVDNLVNTVKGAANFEQTTLTNVVQARAQATSVNIKADQLTPENIAKFQAAQGQLSSSLGRLLAVAENYPDLKATQNFQQLQSQLEGIENDIRNSRKNFNDAVNDYNTKVRSFPVNMFGFSAKEGFKADEGAEKAPKVKF